MGKSDGHRREVTDVAALDRIPDTCMESGAAGRRHALIDHLSVQFVRERKFGGDGSVRPRAPTPRVGKIKLTTDRREHGFDISQRLAEGSCDSRTLEVHSCHCCSLQHHDIGGIEICELALDELADAVGNRGR